MIFFKAHTFMRFLTLSRARQTFQSAGIIYAYLVTSKYVNLNLLTYLAASDTKESKRVLESLHEKNEFANSLTK